MILGFMGHQPLLARDCVVQCRLVFRCEITCQKFCESFCDGIISMKCRKLKPVFRSNYADKGFAKLWIVYFISGNHLLLKSHTPWPVGVGGPWNSKNHWISRKLNLAYMILWESDRSSIVVTIFVCGVLFLICPFWTSIGTSCTVQLYIRSLMKFITLIWFFVATEKSRKSAPSIRRINTITNANGHLEGSSLLWDNAEVNSREIVDLWNCTNRFIVLNYWP